MGVIEVSAVAFAHPGGSELFSDVSFRVGNGQHVALVGENGVGKSTVLGCITGSLTVTEGSIRTDAAVALMPQHLGTDLSGDGPVAAGADTTVRELLADLSDPTLRAAAVRLAAAEHALTIAQQPELAPAGPPKARPIGASSEMTADEAGLALAEAVIVWQQVGGYEAESRWDATTSAVLGQTLAKAGGRPLKELSGGERKQLALHALFSSDAPILVLDEPDNYLDIPAKRWLERRIVDSAKTVLFISHDRELLAASATHIVTLEPNGCWTHAGGWSTYEAARTARNESLGDALQRWNDEERRLYRYMKLLKQRAAVNDGNAPAANAAETRWKRWVDDGPPPPPPPARTVSMHLAGGASGKVVLRAERLELVGLTEPFDLEVHQGERVGVLGPNGTGKSHLLRLLGSDDGVLAEGSWRLGARVVPGLFHQTDDVPEHRGRTLLSILGDHDLNEEAGMRALARYGLAQAARRPVETLSGGQKARLQVLGLELRGVNLLLLDEPTDNLDLGSTEALEASLLQFEGTVLCVTHDRWFMRGMDRWLIIGDDGRVTEALDLDTALHVLTGDDRYPRSPGGLVPLTCGRVT